MKRSIDRSAELEKVFRLGTTDPFARDALHGYLRLKKALDFADHLNDGCKKVGPRGRAY